MSILNLRRQPAALVLAFTMFGAGSVEAGGFELYNHAGKATALGGAFIAQADDPSAIFYNPGAVALLEKKPAVTAGLAIHSNGDSIFQGVAPGLATGFNGEQDTVITPLPHVFVVKELGNFVKVGLGTYSNFFLDTKWAQPDDFPGRALSLETKLTSIDINPVVSFKVTPNFGIGLGAVYRTTELGLTRRLQFINPLTDQVQDFATRTIDTPFEAGFGWNAGVVYRFLDMKTGDKKRLSLGAMARSGIDVDFSGTGRLTQIPSGDEALDQVVRASNPFDQDLGMTTRVEYPSQIGGGVAARLTDRITLEVDVVETEWSSFSGLRLEFPFNPLLSELVPASFQDTSTVRAGVRVRIKSGAEYRAGVVIDESPVPDVTLGPTFPDADSTGLGLGYGKDFLDVSLMWVEFDRRSSRNNPNDFNGNYASNAWTLLMSVSK